jgi:hypothetical protein
MRATRPPILTVGNVLAPDSHTISIASGSGVMSANIIYHIPFFCPKTFTATQACLLVTTGVASSNARIGCYDLKSNGLPNNKLAETAAFSTATSGTKTAALTSSLTLKIGQMYWLAVHASAAITVTTTNSVMGFLGTTSTATGGVDTVYLRPLIFSSGLPDPSDVTTATPSNLIIRAGFVVA